MNSNNSPLLSVVIPVFKVEPYIEECVISLFKQTLENIEYIFVDDASPDNSIKKIKNILLSYPHRKQYVKFIIHESNLGLVKSRKDGMAVASGKWLIHCDSDDKLAPNAYEKLLREAEKGNFDIVICGYFRYWDNNRKEKISQGFGSISPVELIKSISGNSHQHLDGFLWNKLIRRELWQGVNVPDTIVYCEDVVAMYQMLIKNPSLNIFIIPDILYYYRVRPFSLIQKRDLQRYNQIIELINYLENFRRENSEDAINSKIISLLYRAIETGINNYYLHKKYDNYLKYIDYNKVLNRFEKYHLRLILKGKFTLGKYLGFCNRKGRKIVKNIFRFKRFIFVYR